MHDWLCTYIQNNLSGISYVGFRYLSYVFCESAFAVVVDEWRTCPFSHLENRPGLHTPACFFTSSFEEDELL